MNEITRIEDPAPAEIMIFGELDAMTKPHAFQLREYYTCSVCDCNEGGRCTRNDRIIRWRSDRYGCGNFCARSDSEDEVIG